MSNEYKSDVGNTQGGWLKGPMFFVIVALLVGVGSFGMGRLTKVDAEREPVRIEAASASMGEVNGPAAPKMAAETPPTQAPKVEIPESGSPTGQFVASKNGKKYFTLTCSGAKTIKAENRVYFGSQDEAKKAGYEPSATCKDLN